jgi:hypothetical protein
MEWMENEGAELGADDPDAMVRAFGFQHKARVERFHDDFHTAKKKMKSRLPSTFEEMNPQMRSEIQAAIVEFLTAIKDQNTEFLSLCVATYAHKMGVDLD